MANIYRVWRDYGLKLFPKTCQVFALRKFYRIGRDLFGSGQGEGD
jgi:hypothetical protein